MEIIYLRNYRCDVYCKELGYEKVCQHLENSENSEIDDFDRYSEHVLIKHKASGIYAGCVRLVKPPPQNPKALLPFEANCSQSFDPKKVAFLREGENVRFVSFRVWQCGPCLGVELATQRLLMVLTRNECHKRKTWKGVVIFMLLQSHFILLVHPSQ